MHITLKHHTHDTPGFYLEKYRVISTRKGMAVWDYKSVLAHELGHAHYHDKRNGHLYFDERQERRADEFAANLLIDTDTLRYLAPWHGHDKIGLALDLEVTPKLLKTFLELHPYALKGLAA